MAPDSVAQITRSIRDTVMTGTYFKANSRFSIGSIILFHSFYI
jgi:hypothetical protein